MPSLFKVTSEVNGVGIRHRAVLRTGWLTSHCLLSDLLYQRRFVAETAGSDLTTLTGTLLLNSCVYSEGNKSQIIVQNITKVAEVERKTGRKCVM